jgi:hypothetical protein
MYQVFHLKICAQGKLSCNLMCFVLFKWHDPYYFFVACRTNLPYVNSSVNTLYILLSCWNGLELMFLCQLLVGSWAKFAVCSNQITSWKKNSKPFRLWSCNTYVNMGRNCKEQKSNTGHVIWAVQNTSNYATACPVHGFWGGKLNILMYKTFVNTFVLLIWMVYS